MKNLNVKLLLNRITYDPSADLLAIKKYFTSRGVNLTFNEINTDIHGYSVKQVTNPFGNLQYVLTGAESLVGPYLSPTDDICAFVIEGFKEFGVTCPSESEDKVFLPGTKTVFLSANADDSFSDQEPNFKIWLMHELMHALGTLAINDGFPIVDCMDTLIDFQGRVFYYLLNYSPEDPNSNFTNMWERLYHSGWLHYD